jgi:hypothetical protein
VRLQSLSHWMCNTGAGGSTAPESFYPLPGMPATPKPRHTYSQFVYASSGVYLMHGSMGSDQHLNDFFGSAYSGASSQRSIFDAASKVWTAVSNPGGVPWSTGRDNAGLQYNSAEDVYMLLGADGRRDLWIYNPATGVWTDLTPSPLPILWPPNGNEDGAYNVAYSEDLNALVRYDERDGSMWLYRHGGGGMPLEGPSRPRRLKGGREEP